MIVHRGSPLAGCLSRQGAEEGWIPGAIQAGIGLARWLPEAAPRAHRCGGSISRRSWNDVYFPFDFLQTGRAPSARAVPGSTFFDGCEYSTGSLLPRHRTDDTMVASSNINVW